MQWQSDFLQNLNIQQGEYKKIVEQLKTNKLLRNIINEGDAKKAMINAISALLKELEETK